MGSVAAPLWSPPRSSPTLRARHGDGGAAFRVLELSGEADVATVRMLAEELARARVADGCDVVVDVSELTFCDVASARLLRTAQRSVPVALRGATGPVKRVLDLVDALQEDRIPRHLQ